MAASITIQIFLNDQGGTLDAPLVSAFTTNSIEFEFNREALTGTYAKVEINGVSFFATMIEKDRYTGIDAYVIDLTNILPSFLGIETIDSLLTESLSKVITIDVFGYNSAGTQIASDLTHPDIELCFGYPKIGVGGGLDGLWYSGRSTGRTVFTNGTISFYFSDTAGTYALTMDGGETTRSEALNAGFNVLSLQTHLLKSGTFQRDGVPVGLSVDVVYRPAKAEHLPIYWIDRDGCWSSWAFRLLSTNNDVQRSKEVPIYAYTNTAQKGKTRQIGAAKSIDFIFDTIAVNDEHYSQLTEIIESPLVIYDGRIVKVADSSSSTAACKQNLRFNITLKMQENVVSY